jgi:hypothetical protein
MNMTRILNSLFWNFHIGMGFYGFTRGLRSNYDKETRKPLIFERVMGSVANSTTYFIPIWSFYQLYRLCNRVEIYLRDLKKEDYIKDYQEPFCGNCFSTL